MGIKIYFKNTALWVSGVAFLTLPSLPPYKTTLSRNPASSNIEPCSDLLNSLLVLQTFRNTSTRWRKYTPESRKSILQVIANRVNSTQAQEITRQLTDGIDHALSNDMGSLDAASFHRLLGNVLKLAEQHGIQIEKTMGSFGVYPDGVRKLRVSGLSVLQENAGNENAPSFVALHELAHLYHTVHLRAILLSSFESEGQDIHAWDEILGEYVHLLENGMSYLEYEKAVSSLASFIHTIPGAKLQPDVYKKSLIKLLEMNEKAAQIGKFRYPNGKTLAEVYGLFISRMPLVVGKSGTEAFVRMPLYWFAAYYVLNVEVGPTLELAGVDLSQLREKMKSESSEASKRADEIRFRDFVHWIVGLD